MTSTEEDSEKENEGVEEEIVILTGKDCPPCREIEKLLEGKETKIKYRFVDVNSEEGQAIIKAGTERLELPLALRVKKKVTIEECEIFHDRETVLIKDKKGEITALKE